MVQITAWPVYLNPPEFPMYLYWDILFVSKNITLSSTVENQLFHLMLTITKLLVNCFLLQFLTLLGILMFALAFTKHSTIWTFPFRDALCRAVSSFCKIKHLIV